MSDSPTPDELVAHRVGGATYEAIGLLYGLPPHRVRYYCRRAVKAGKVTAEQIGWNRQPRALLIPPEKYKEHWLKRIFAKVKQDANGCWIWQGQVSANGYAQDNYRGKTKILHRQLYQVFYDVALTRKPQQSVCHLCDVRLCINPLHLWVGTQKENLADCVRKGRHQETRKTECERGHPYTPETTYVSKGREGRGARSCKICQTARNRIRAGWPEDLAYSLPPVKHGYRPVNAKGFRKRTTA